MTHKKSPLRFWLFIGFMLLVLNSGFINSIAILGYFKVSVGNMTGNITNLGVNLESFQWLKALDLLILALSFMLGAVINGLAFSSTQFSIQNRYGFSMLLQAALIFASYICLHEKDALVLHVAEFLLAAAAGMQNSMTTMYSGAIIRTTHITGILTDLGVSIGHVLRGRFEEFWKINLFFWTIVFMIVGAMLGTHLYHLCGVHVVLISAGLVFIAAIGYFLLKSKGRFSLWIS